MFYLLLKCFVLEMKIFTSPEKKTKIEVETPSKYLNLNSNISSFRPWSNLSLSHKKQKKYFGSDQIQKKQIKPFHQEIYESGIKIEEEEKFMPSTKPVFFFDQKMINHLEKIESLLLVFVFFIYCDPFFFR